MSKRVVITGLGVVSPNGIGLTEFEESLRKGRSGIRFIPELEELKFACQVGAVPQVEKIDLNKYFTPLQQKTLRSHSILFGCVAAQDAWNDAGLTISTDEEAEPDWDTGCVFGMGISGIEVLRESIYKVDDLNVKRLGSTVVEQTMGSGISAYLCGILGLGNQVTTNSSACSTGSEAVLMGFNRIRAGLAKRMVVGSCDSYGPYVWGGFDSMRVLNRKYNDAPEKASRPMDANASGFVPGGGAGALILEEYDYAVARGARIYAEIKGGCINSGGHRNGGTMTAPNSRGIQRCIHTAINDADITPDQIDAINGHLTSTMGDVLEVKNWGQALNRSGSQFPHIQSTKSLIGHCLAAAGSIESVGVVLQLYKDFFHPSVNCDELHPEIQSVIDEQKVPEACLTNTKFLIIAKSSFGFGDVNSCIIFQKFKG